jgi:hypothetical protein
MTATICEHCGWCDDPARERRCPCRTPAASELEVLRRHRASVARARTADMRRTARRVA